MYVGANDLGKFDQYLARKAEQYGDRFDPSDLARAFVPYFESGARIKVRTVYGGGEDYGLSTGDYVRTGTVGVTSGWRPAFLLMHRSNAVGSSDLLSDRDQVIAIKIGREYVPVSPAGSRYYH